MNPLDELNAYIFSAVIEHGETYVGSNDILDRGGLLMRFLEMSGKSQTRRLLSAGKNQDFQKNPSYEKYSDIR